MAIHMQDPVRRAAIDEMIREWRKGSFASMTADEITAHCAEWYAANRPANGQNATDAQVASAVAAYLVANPPAAGAPGAPKRIEEYSANTNASGIATFTWTAFASINAILVRERWVSSQYVGGGEVSGSRSLSGVQIQGMRSRGTLLLSAGPFEVCPSGVTLSIIVFGS